MDTTENCWSFFINKARALSLRCGSTVLLCFTNNDEGRQSCPAASRLIIYSGCLCSLVCQLLSCAAFLRSLVWAQRVQGFDNGFSDGRSGRTCTSSSASVRWATSFAFGLANSLLWSTACSTTGADSRSTHCVDIGIPGCACPRILYSQYTVVCRFHPWPAEALVSVASRFLVDLPAAEESVRDAIASHMAFAHQTVTTASKQ